jgi:hypothetical protein
VLPVATVSLGADVGVRVAAAAVRDAWVQQVVGRVRVQQRFLDGKCLGFFEAALFLQEAVETRSVVPLAHDFNLLRAVSVSWAAVTSEAVPTRAPSPQPPSPAWPCAAA